MGVGVGRMVAWLAFLSLIAFAAYQFPAEDTFAHLRSWYPLGQSEGSQVTATSVNKDPNTLNLTKSQDLDTGSSLTAIAPSDASTGPRVAVCLVGAARAFELTGKTLDKYLLEANNHTDVFLHAPLDKDSHKFTLLKGAARFVKARIFVPQRLPETQIQREVLTGANSPNGIQGLLQYFNLVEGCLDMIKAEETKQNFTYDWIIRTRVDGYWSGPFPPLSTLNSSNYYVPFGSAYGGLNDRLGVGNSQTSTAALSRLRLLPLIHHHGDRNLNSETAFKAQLNVAKVSYSFMSFPFCILSYRRYSWPPTYWGVPVASLSTDGPLNGAKCRPCSSKASGSEAQAVIDKLAKGWGWPGLIQGLQLCDAHNDWEPQWEKIFEKASGVLISGDSQNVTTRTPAGCVEDVEEFQKQWEVWDAPTAKLICSEGKTHKS